MSGVLALAVAIGIVFGARKLCEVIKAPLWFAKLLFIYAFIVITYFLADEIVPDSKKPWGILVAILGAATGIIPVGFIVFKHIGDNDATKVRDPSRPHSEKAETRKL